MAKKDRIGKVNKPGGTKNIPRAPDPVVKKPTVTKSPTKPTTKTSRTPASKGRVTSAVSKTPVYVPRHYGKGVFTTDHTVTTGGDNRSVKERVYERDTPYARQYFAKRPHLPKPVWWDKAKPKPPTKPVTPSKPKPPSKPVTPSKPKPPKTPTKPVTPKPPTTPDPVRVRAPSGLKIEAPRATAPITQETRPRETRSQDTVREKLTCKARPRDNRPKGGGGSKRFVPWCS